MKLKSIESFGLVPFLSYLIFGWMAFKILSILLKGPGIGDSFEVITSSIVFMVLSGLSLGNVTAVALTRHSAYTRKALGFMLGLMVPIVNPIFTSPEFLGSLAGGFLIGLALMKRRNTQLRFAKAFVPLPLLYLMLPYLSAIFNMISLGTIVEDLDVTLSNLRVIAALLVYDIVIFVILRHAAIDEESTKESTLFLGPSKSGKTILSLGLFHAIVQGNVGGLKATSDSMVLVDKNEPSIRLEDLYDTFVRAGFTGVKGTMRGWLSISVFDLSRKFLDKFLFGLKDLSLEITDYAGEDLWNIAEIVEDKSKYRERIVEAFRAETNPGDKKKFENFMKAVIFPRRLDPKNRAAYAATLRARILKDLERGTFDFRKYRGMIRWEELPEAIRTPLATAHTYRGIVNATRIVFLLDGEKILYELYKRDPDFRTNLEFLKSTNERYYNKIMNVINNLSEIEERLGDPTLNKKLRETIGRETLGQHLNAYRRIVLASKSKVKKDSFIFLVTKADLIGAVFNSDILSIRLEGLKRRVLRILRKAVLFKNFLKNLNINEKDLSNKLMFSIIVPRRELVTSDYPIPLTDEILVKGLDRVVEWIRKTSKARIIKEALKP